MTLPRRTFLKNLGLLIAAPAIVRVSSLMPVKAFAEDPMLALIESRLCRRITPKLDNTFVSSRKGRPARGGFLFVGVGGKLIVPLSWS
jgi:hypothetical protein